MSKWEKRAKIVDSVVVFNYNDEDSRQQYAEAHIWDIDKTYLDSTYDSLKGIFNIIFEKPEEKQNVVGSAQLAQSLQECWVERTGNEKYPLFFITASPPQLEAKIKKKLYLDGLRPFALYCKDNLQNLKPSRLWRLTHQIGYKIIALLILRTSLANDVKIVLWGDDSESDATIYNLFSDVCSRRYSESELRKILKQLKVVKPQIDLIIELQEQIPEYDPVDKIYINLAEDTDPEFYLKYGRRVMASRNTFQTALDLFQDGRLSNKHVCLIAKYLRNEIGLTSDELENSFDNLIRRKILGREAVEELLPKLIECQVITSVYKPSVDLKEIVKEVDGRVYELESSFEPWVPEEIDYLNDYR